MGFSISESEEVTLISSRGAVLCSLWRPVALVPGKFSLMDFFPELFKISILLQSLRGRGFESHFSHQLLVARDLGLARTISRYFEIGFIFAEGSEQGVSCRPYCLIRQRRKLMIN